MMQRVDKQLRGVLPYLKKICEEKISCTPNYVLNAKIIPVNEDNVVEETF